MRRIQGPSDIYRTGWINIFMSVFFLLPISNLRVSPIGLVPKRDNIGWRLTTHLAISKINSVNSFIDPNETAKQYT